MIGIESNTILFSELEFSESLAVPYIVRSSKSANLNKIVKLAG